jgi:hypothetical protein
MLGMQFSLMLCVVFGPVPKQLCQASSGHAVAWHGIHNLSFQCVATSVQHTANIACHMIMIQHSLSGPDGISTQGTAALLLGQ